jgi:formylglycine-generating enzyme required for sulfatase activity
MAAQCVSNRRCCWPGGSFLAECSLPVIYMGSIGGLPNERPEHTVTLHPYYIDQYEVTLTLYRKLLESEKQESPPA